MQPDTKLYFVFVNASFKILKFVLATSVARILQWGEVKNDITFDHTLYTKADPESFGGADVILNQFEY